MGQSKLWLRQNARNLKALLDALNEKRQFCFTRETEMKRPSGSKQLRPKQMKLLGG